MKINNKIISIPPYISTSWGNVDAVHYRGGVLYLSLSDGNEIEIPGLRSDIIDTIFSTHEHYLESHVSSENHEDKFFLNHESSSGGNQVAAPPFGALEFPFRVGLGTFDTLGSALQHNPLQANAPELPKEVISKISAIANIIAPEASFEIPKAEEGCNCFHCQIARAICRPLGAEEKAEAQEEVTDEDLKFQEWTIVQTGESLYTVTNCLDSQEKYNVFLGHPVGCTCGKQGCEHILAVLKS